MTHTIQTTLPAIRPAPSLPSVSDATDYAIDAWQRSLLFLDTLRRRSDQYREHMAEAAPHVLSYEHELVLDGRTLDRPVNYGLVRIVPPDGVDIDPVKRPFVVVDPRAGHGPGIGGFKADSEIGVALKAGHACYFVGFLPDPEPGQTIEDIARAEAVFLETVIARHPEAEGLPCVIGNCQAGWAVMMLAAIRPELFGPIIVAGSPLSYWAGVHGRNPMRYSGGLLGGSWLTALSSDLGGGLFDGAALVQNFENQNPANTLWTKQYNLYSKIDTEAERYLGFEKYWGGHVLLNGEEIQFIVDELFVGNKLAAGEIRTSDGMGVDLRNIRSPIVVLCSKGDNITPPQQALGWILDLYDSEDEIRAWGQTIVYVVHETIGHLGIFVSGSVARKEHEEFACNIHFIDTLPPGLYEAVLEPKANAANPELVNGEWMMRCEPRTLDDIRAMGGNTPSDDRAFAAAARVSEINLALYRTWAAPAVRALWPQPLAEALRRLHPLRLPYELMASGSPASGVLAAAAEQVRDDRRPAAPGNPLVALQEQVSDGIVAALDRWRGWVEHSAEATFFAIYGNETLQSALGIDPEAQRRPRKAAKSLIHSALVRRRIEGLRGATTHGGLREAMVRTLVYVNMARGSVDERDHEAIRRLRARHDEARRMTLADFKRLVREQYLMLLIDRNAAVAAIPALLPADAAPRQEAMDFLRDLLSAGGPLTGAAADRLAEAEALFGVDGGPPRGEHAPLAIPAPAPSVAGRRRTRS